MSQKKRLAIALLGLIGFLSYPTKAAFIESPSKQYETVKANIVNNDPSNFTIDIYSLANLFVDEEAPSFAIYVSTSAPKTCANFLDLKLEYKKPEKYQRIFDLSKHQEILTALDQYKCIIIKNIPLN